MESVSETNSRIFNRRSTFGQQMIALIRRNILIKRRNRGRTLLVIIFILKYVNLIKFNFAGISFSHLYDINHNFYKIFDETDH